MSVATGGVLEWGDDRLILSQARVLRNVELLQLSAAGTHVLLLTAGHEVYVMGGGRDGQLGLGEVAVDCLPVSLLPLLLCSALLFSS